MGEDFNAILDEEEKLGGRPYRASRSFDFALYIKHCDLVDAGYIGETHTWCNNRRARKRIWKRLDRILINDLWIQRFQSNSVRHLVRTCSDHRPLLMKCHAGQQQVIKYFRFLDFCVEQPSFKDLVRATWMHEIRGNPMWRLQQKLKLLSKALSHWSKEVVGDVFRNISEWET